MSGNIATYGNPAQATNVYHRKELLKHAGPIAVTDRYAKKFSLPQNESETISMDRLVPFGFDATAATEGVVPESVGMDYENIQATIQEYEHLARVSSRKWRLSEQAAVRDAAKLQAEFMVNVNELLRWNELTSGTGVFYDTSAHTARNQVDTAITLGRIRKMTRSLDDAKAMHFTRINRGGAREGTVPTEPGYVALGHTNMKADVRNLPGFVHCSEKGNGSKQPWEFGVVEDVTFVLTPQLFPIAGAGAASDGTKINNGSANDVYPLVVMGEEAFGTIVLAGFDSVKPNIMSGPVKGADPTGKFVDIGVLWYYVAKILNENWLTRGEFAVTLNP
jgi:N4-gp56 family major capsid protein